MCEGIWGSSRRCRCQAYRSKWLREREAPRWSLAPSAARASAIDQGLRLRLANSLSYLAELDALEDRSEALATLETKLKAGPVSPWVFCLYSKLVADLAKDASGDAAQSFDAVARAAELPAAAGMVAFHDPAIEGAWWDHFHVLLDTDQKRPFKPQPSSAAIFALCKQEIEAAQDLMRRADPAWHDEVSYLLRMIVLAAPESPDLDHIFNGASTFFFWGATFLNADLRRTAISLADLLVHESSHVLLFGLGAESALTRNSGDERYSSPLRARPPSHRRDLPRLLRGDAREPGDEPAALRAGFCPKNRAERPNSGATLTAMRHASRLAFSMSTRS